MKFKFSGTLLRFVDYNKLVEIDADSLGDALGKLTGLFPSVKAPICDAQGSIRRTHRLFLNGEMMLGFDARTAVAPSDTVEVLTAIAGG
jgi:molybdopterin synthase sulfur carrier subunit